MKKILRFLALAMLFAMTGNNFALASNRPILGIIGMTQVPKGASIIVNNVTTDGTNYTSNPENIVAFQFYDSNQKVLQSYGTIAPGQFIVIPQNAAFMKVIDSLQTLVNMAPVNSAQSYSFEVQNSEGDGYETLLRPIN